MREKIVDAISNGRFLEMIPKTSADIADEILKELTREIKKVEKTNPYSMKTTEGLAWWQGCQKILNLLEGK